MSERRLVLGLEGKGGRGMQDWQKSLKSEPWGGHKNSPGLELVNAKPGLAGRWRLGVWPKRPQRGGGVGRLRPHHHRD